MTVDPKPNNSSNSLEITIHKSSAEQRKDKWEGHILESAIDFTVRKSTRQWKIDLDQIFFKSPSRTSNVETNGTRHPKCDRV